MYNRIKNIIKTLLFAVFLCGIFQHPYQVMADEISGKKDALDVIFVVDASGSMKTNDPEGIALEMVKAFVDTIHADDISVGFVAYNDKIVSASAPVSMAEQGNRENLKSLINSTIYSGNTDIGLGLAQAYQSLQVESGKKSIIVLISDGETDLQGSNTGRTEAVSDEDVAAVIQNCRQHAIPIYTIAFGSYSGSAAGLQTIAEETGATDYIAQNPDLLIEILYGILSDNLSYKIRPVSASTYAQGKQEIRVVLNDDYLNEVDVLLISPQQIGATGLMYGETPIPMTAMTYYAVGKIDGSLIDNNIRDITIHTEAAKDQSIKAYVIGYRSLEPILNIDTSAARNEAIPYQVYFKDAAGEVIKDEAFYRKMNWSESLQNQPAAIRDGYLQGTLNLPQSGSYRLEGQLSDELGSYQFAAELQIHNAAPAGSLPEMKYNTLNEGDVWNLDEYFTDAEGDVLSYTVETGAGNYAEFVLEGNKLSVKPLKPGIQTAALLVSDGEAVYNYPLSVQILPLWQVYWWIIVIVTLIIGVILGKVLRRPDPDAEFAQIVQEKASNRFNGKLDAYFTMLPDHIEEIPPLVFQLYKVKDSKLCLGDLLRAYPEVVEALNLEQVFLIADEGRRIILYHSSDATIMLGNSIVCKQVRYDISFGDVIYIASADGTYDLELRYISVIQ